MQTFASRLEMSRPGTSSMNDSSSMLTHRLTGTREASVSDPTNTGHSHPAQAPRPDHAPAAADRESSRTTVRRRRWRRVADLRLCVERVTGIDPALSALETEGLAAEEAREAP